MLRPLAVAVIGALFISVLLSLIATPVVYYLLTRLGGKIAAEQRETEPRP
jgi:Cu/Ag efflux pump CusA